MDEILLKVEQCQFGYQKPLLESFDFFINPGEVVILLGENGTGKSTFLNVCTGNQKSLSGNIYLENKNLNELSIHEIAKKICLVRNLLEIPERILVKEFVALGALSHPWDFVEQILKLTSTLELSDRTLISLSDGERSRVLLAEALVRNTSLLIFDEPTAFLDVPHSIGLLKLCKKISREQNKSFFLTTHQIELALKFADKILVFEKSGKVSYGSPEEISNSTVIDWAKVDVIC